MYPITQEDWDRYRETVLDHGLNMAILTICRRLLPQGFDVAETAPDTYEAIVTLFESGQRYVVYAGGSENTIYGDPEVNYHFRAWHDWCHWQGKYDFSLAGELGAYHLQCDHLVAIYGASDTTRRWQRILYADIIGQKLYFRQHGSFPTDQMTFVRQYLETANCPAAAVPQLGDRDMHTVLG
jgi:hypothetical protein